MPKARPYATAGRRGVRGLVVQTQSLRGGGRVRLMTETMQRDDRSERNARCFSGMPIGVARHVTLDTDGDGTCGLHATFGLPTRYLQGGMYPRVAR